MNETPAQINAALFVKQLATRGRLVEKLKFEEWTGIHGHRMMAVSIGCPNDPARPHFLFGFRTEVDTIEDLRAAVLAEIEKEKQKL